MTFLDPVGAALSLLSTCLFVNAKRSAWIVGVFAILVNTTLYMLKGLYGQVVLETVYLFFMFYGLYLWSQGIAQKERAIQNAPIRLWLYLGALNLIGISVSYWVLRQGFDSSVPFWDACILSLSLTAQWLLCQKIAQCWLLWFIVDAMVVWLHMQKGIPFHAGIHFLYLFLAVSGHLRWKRLHKAQRDPLLDGLSHL